MTGKWFCQLTTLLSTTVAELLKFAKEKPGQFSFGSSGIVTPPHVAGQLFQRIAGIEVVHVPYKGAAPALSNLLGGRLTYTIDSPVMQLPQAKMGKLRVLAVTALQRVSVAPEVPSLAESGLAARTGYC